VKPFIATLLVAVTLISTASAKKSTVDFTPFAGTYSGTYSLSGGPTYFAPVVVKVKVPKSGKSLTVIPSGVLTVTGTSYALGGFLTLGPKKKAQLSSVYFIPSVIPTFGTGTFSGKKNHFSFAILSSVSNTSFATNGTLAFSKRGMNLTMVTNLFGTPVTITITGRKKK